MDRDLMYWRREREKVPRVHPITWPLGVTECLRRPESAGFKPSVLGPGRGALKVTLEGLGQPLVVELEPRAMRAARGNRRDPAGRWGPERPLPEPAGCGEAGAPLWVRSPLGWARSPAGRDAGWGGRGRRQGGRARGKRAGLSFVRGFARRGRASRGYRPPPLALSGGGALPRALGRGGRGLCEPSGWSPGFLAPNRAEAPPPPPRPPILSAAPFPSARVAPFPCPRRGSASALLPLALRVALPGFQGGCPGGAGRGGAAARGRGRRAARQPSTCSERRVSGPLCVREEGSPPPGPSGAFCSQPEVCMPGP